MATGLTEPAAPWESKGETATTVTDSAKTEAAPQPAQESAETNLSDDPDFKVFQDSLSRTVRKSEPKAEQPDAATAEKSGEEAKPDSEPNPEKDGQPAIELTDKAIEYAKELGLKTDQPDAALDVALEAWRREGIFDDDEISEKFNANPKRFVTQGLKLRMKQKAQDEYGRSYREFEKDPEKFINEYMAKRQPKGKDAPVDDKAKSAKPEEPVSIPASVQEVITKALEGVQGDDLYDADNFKQMFSVGLTKAAESIERLYQQNLKEMSGKHAEDVSGLREHNEKLRAMLINIQLDGERTRLQDQYPDLKRDDVWERVLTTYDDFAGSGKYDSVTAALRKAAAAELGEESASKLRERLLTEHANRKKNQPRTPTQSANAGSNKQSAIDPDERVYLESVRRTRGEKAAAGIGL